MKRFTILLFIITSAHICHAQRIGLKAGFNFSNIYGDIDTTTLKVGFQAGLLAELKVSEALRLQPELLFTLQGADDNEHPEDKVSLNYVSLPVVAKFYLHEDVSLHLGPRLGMLVMAQTTHDETDIQIEDDLRKWDFGLTGGVGYQGDNLMFSLRYYQGLTDVKKLYRNQSLLNQSIEISLGILFDNKETKAKKNIFPKDNNMN